ncbi:MAG: DUF262 domain-containing HNH endonuclease family protein [Planctomycetaceae bacterium]|jgi:uncharacterized protein with ParB-like and HNH nuclease domain|nr:DUF262 domain-containing HNH endonuclease family protein [Planctomycetaceae bacterium]
MKTESHSINDVLMKNSTSFFIPPFQRAYAWGKPEIDRYFCDIIRIIDSELNTEQHDKLEHFFGTVVIKEESEGFANKSVVVDGQQRLTTTLIFLIALRDLESDETHKNYITENYLKNNTSTFEDKIKLKQVTKDWEAYKALVNGDEPEGGIIKNAYQLFSKLVTEKKEIIYETKSVEIKFEHYIKAIQRMNVAVIFLDERPHKGEDPQIIFETLNSLGKPLTLADLVRNFVLLAMNSEQQSDIYEKTWHPKIEAILNEKTSDFFRDYLQYKKAISIKVVSDNNTKEIYQIFKDFVNSSINNGTFANHKDFINDIVRYVNWYKWIISETYSNSISCNITKDKEIKEIIRNIFHDIKSEAFKPFVLGLLEYHQNKKMSDDLLVSILKTIRTYLIRRRILGESQGENKNIVLLSKRIEELVNSTTTTTMLDLLSDMFYKMRFPNDDEIIDALKTMDFYNGLKKYSKFILGKIEENNTKVAVNFRDTKITIEHVMPQKLSKDWESELGDNFKDVHKKFLHNIGNLVLTEFNSEIGNKTFGEKKAKLNTSSLNFRLDVINREVWDETSISEHRNNMNTWLLETFPLPDTHKHTDNWNTKKTEEIINFSPCNDDAGEVAEGKKPSKLIIGGKNINVTTWQNVFIEFLKWLKNSREYDFSVISDNQNELFNKEKTIIKWSELETIINETPDLKNRYKTFDGKFCDREENLTVDSEFIYINCSASTFISRIANVMNKFNIPEDFVAIILR